MKLIQVLWVQKSHLEGRFGSFLWRISEKPGETYIPQCKNSSLAVSVSVVLFLLFCTLGKHVQNSLSQNTAYCHRKSETSACIWTQNCNQHLLNSTTFWVSAHCENPPWIKCSRGSKKFKMLFHPGLGHTTRSILSIKSFLLVNAVWGWQSGGDARHNKQTQQATCMVTWEDEGSNKEVEGTVLSWALWWLNPKAFCFSAWTF